MSRDTQFQGFAKALAEELIHEGFIEFNDSCKVEDIIARRACDLVEHTVGYSMEYLHECGHELSGGMGSRITPSIPDMTELPKEQEG